MLKCPQLLILKFQYHFSKLKEIFQLYNINKYILQLVY